MRYLLISFLCILSFPSLAQRPVEKTSAPRWVHSVSPSLEHTLDPQGGFQYLLIDQQFHLPRQTAFFHYVAQVFTSEGVQSLSDISITYDPSFQRLQLHKLTLRRGNKVIDKLAESQVRTLQRETSLERSLYDGSLTAVINLSDVRPSDIIEYSYSLIGFNPIYQGHFATTLYHQHPVPVTRIYNRVTAPAKQTINLSYYEGATEPTISRSDNQVVYTWDVAAQDYQLPATNLPPNIDPFRRVALSTYASWQEVVEWAVPLYTYAKRSLSPIAASLPDAYDQERKLLSMIHLVQDDIRYLGFEGGISGYQPHAPATVFKQRYGDCKDKSLLLVALLRSEGVEANPLLVNTQLRSGVQDVLPSPHAFDHCIVHFRYQGKEHIVDPTISAQGGNLSRRAFPNYERGLLIKPGTAELLRLPRSPAPQVTIQEVIQVDSVGGAAHLVVRSEYTGGRADDMRRQFQTQRKAAIEQSYLDFYRNLYPSVIVEDTIRFYDYDRTTLNKVMVEEFYRIPTFWNRNDDGSLLVELYPIVLASQLGYPSTPSRPSPYYLGEPYSYAQTTQVELPEDWPVTPSKQHISGPGFDYHNQVQGSGNTVAISHHYTLNQYQIPGDSVEMLLSQQEALEDELSLFLTYDASLAGFHLSWVATLVAILVAGAGIWLAVRIYRQYDPPAWRYAENKPIGSWLILPALGLAITPFWMGKELFFAGEYFNQATWQGLKTSEQATSLALLVGVELVYNVLFLVFTFLVLAAFYQRRTSTPRLITIFYLVSLVVPVLDGWATNFLVGDIFSEQDQLTTYRDIGRSFVAAAIWIPYFNFSERVKSTFCKRRPSRKGSATVTSSNTA